MKWFVEARFGLSLHFGLYSIAGRGEWIRSAERLSVEAYQQYFDSFQPTPVAPASGQKQRVCRSEILRPDRQAPRWLLPVGFRADFLQIHQHARTARDIIRE
jgi:hypothetical protein